MFQFDEKELEAVGCYELPPCFGKPAAQVPKYDRPITPRENMLRVFRGEKPMWVPNNDRDVNYVQPYIMPDSYARSFGGTDWFGIEWVYEPKSKAAMVKPGTRVLSDITAWREEVKFPDLMEIDWQENYDTLYKAHIPNDRFTVFCIVNGLFERTADMMGFEDTFVALLTEPEELTAFYDKLVDWHIQLMAIARKYYHADMILFHDDMGTQISTFFSPEVYQELFVPQYQKITRAAHDLGMHITLHSCGCIRTIIPLIIEAGFDGWEGQDSANDKEAIMAEFGRELVQYSLLYVPESYTDEEAVAFIHGKMDSLGASGRYACKLLDPAGPRRKVNLQDELYRYSRTLFATQQGRH